MPEEMHFIFLALVVLLAWAAPASLRREQRSPGIVGSVSPAFKVSIRPGWRLPETPGRVRVAAESTGLRTLEVTVSAGAIAGATKIALPLEIRTNEPYDLKLGLISQECSPAIAVSIGSVRASGPSVSPSARDVTRYKGQIDLLRCLKPVTALRGPRVSRGGTFDTPGNALSAELNLTISPNTGGECSWRARFRISINPSQ